MTIYMWISWCCAALLHVLVGAHYSRAATLGDSLYLLAESNVAGTQVRTPPADPASGVSLSARAFGSGRWSARIGLFDERDSAIEPLEYAS
eukprot:9091103-Pyramimonas_sp.AAC.2